MFYKLQVRYLDCERLFESYYFPFVALPNPTVIPHQNKKESWLRKDITSGILLQHKFRQNLYYCVRMDWKEMTVPSVTKDWEFDYPRLHKEIKHDFQQI